jgi:hypothetical protein
LLLASMASLQVKKIESPLDSRRMQSNRNISLNKAYKTTKPTFNIVL